MTDDKIKLDNGIILLRIPPGSGIIGVNGIFQPARNKPKIDVEISHTYYLSETPITSQQWESIGMRDPSRFSDAVTPVESVTRRLALAWIVKLNKKYPTVNGIRGEFRLPTEVEWEYAARAGDRSKKPGRDYDFLGMNVGKRGGGMVQGSLEANFIAAGGKPRPVANLSANAWGLKGMIGDVAEHCADPYIETNSSTPRDGSVRKGRGNMFHGKEMFAQRGGSFDINPKDMTYYWKAGVSDYDADARDGMRIAWGPI